MHVDLKGGHGEGRYDGNGEQTVVERSRVEQIDIDTGTSQPASESKKVEWKLL